MHYRNMSARQPIRVSDVIATLLENGGIRSKVPPVPLSLEGVRKNGAEDRDQDPRGILQPFRRGHLSGLHRKTRNRVCRPTKVQGQLSLDSGELSWRWQMVRTDASDG